MGSHVPWQRIGLSAGITCAWLLVRWALRHLEDGLRARASRRTLWAEKAVTLAIGAVALIAIASVWFHDPGHLAIFSGLLAGGAAFASQKLFQSIAGFFVIVFGRTFDLGERVEMGGVRGDVIDIGLLKTTVMEMGVPETLQPDPKHWINARQYTGRIVTLTNDVVFEKPVFNYSRNFDFIWEEMQIPIKFDADLGAAEQILLDAARAETAGIGREAERNLGQLRGSVLLDDAQFDPRVFVRLTDNWVELSLRFVCRPHGVRDLKDRMSRRILEAFNAKRIDIASSTFAVVGLPRVDVVEH